MIGAAVLFACLALCHGGAVLPLVAPVHHAAVVAPVAGYAGHGLGGVGYGPAGLAGAGHVGAGYLGAGHAGAGYGAGLGAGYGAGLGAGVLGAGHGAGLGAGYGAGLGAGYGAGLGAGYGAGLGAGYGAGVGAGLGGAGLAKGHHILKRSPTLVAPVGHIGHVAHVAPVAVSHQSRVDLSHYGSSVVHGAALPLVKPVVAPAVYAAPAFGAGHGYY